MSEDRIKQLASLPRLEYEQCREEEAKRLGIRVSVLDGLVKATRRNAESNSLNLAEPEPWPEPVDGDDLLDRIEAAILRYMVIEPHSIAAVALWVLHAHAFDAAHVSPRLAITSPTMRCGKTTLLTVLERLCPRSLQTANITPAAVFRTVDAARPTLLIDEADTFMKGNEELRGILNSSHVRASACVVRLVGDKYEPKRFSTWCPMAIARIGKLPPTLADRSIPVALQRAMPGEKAERLRLDRLGHLDELARMAARWAADNLARLANADPDVPDALHDRAQDNWRPLIAIAEEAGGDWPDRARRAALALSGRQQIDDEVKTQLLADLKRLFDEQDAEKLFSQDICAALAEIEDRPWPEWRQGKPITSPQLARLLKPFKITSSTIRVDGKTAKGYKLAAFEDTFARWLPSQNVTPSQVNDSLGFGPESKRHNQPNVTVLNSPKPSKSLGCDGVTDEKGDGDIDADEGDLEERLAIMEYDGEVDLAAEMPDFLRR